MTLTSKLVVLAVVPGFLIAAPCRADMVSDYFNKPMSAAPYSKEKPNSEMYGRGESGRRMEASMLRFHGEQDLQENNIDEAIKKLGKAVMLDPGDPTGHVVYARAITAKLFTNKGEIDEELLKKCMLEWRQLQLHDADYIEQMEAKANYKRLYKIAKALAKQKQTIAKEEEQEKLEKAKEAKSKVAEGGNSTTK
jgi:hypothetical protein